MKQKNPSARAGGVSETRRPDRLRVSPRLKSSDNIHIKKKIVLGIVWLLCYNNMCTERCSIIFLKENSK